MTGFALLAFISSCQKAAVTDAPMPGPTLPGGTTYKATPVDFKKPANFPEPAYALANNPLTEEGIELGRQLFYDPRLSRDTSVSCGFCHQQFVAFAHADHSLAHGIGGQFGTRNAQALQNLAWSREFFWDGGVTNLDGLPMAPIENPVEMDIKLPDALDRVRRIPKYPPLFKQAFGSDTVTTARFMKALSQFMLTMVSANSRYDKYIRKETGGDLTSDELAGLTIFKAKCATCHATDLFTDNTFRNNGLDLDSKLNDQGRYRITLNEADRLKFRVPSLRNIERSSPYMHDGRMATLDQVLDHYSDGVKDSPTLDPVLRQNGRPGIGLSVTEKRQLIAFLLTLTDTNYLTDRRLSAP